MELKSRLAIISGIEILKDFPDSFPQNVKKLKNHQDDYRIRIGRYRVLFNYDRNIKIVFIEEVKKRDERTY
ncbi:MAG TPA: type II toxin-antitoxin system RelE/ParE family toxin [Caldithrix abyssi]|uniref:Type II toxin-antitoxin system RelE/ParE family toxin n=1 Tax=Caldithrix abyssi TaxID=187145 RepID=A0A7V4WWE9_CALAY|nr:type II toxin-antitoxin system RelE/ParE family toxin [Caldithrix abyssi]